MNLCLECCCLARLKNFIKCWLLQLFREEWLTTVRLLEVKVALHFVRKRSLASQYQMTYVTLRSLLSASEVALACLSRVPAPLGCAVTVLWCWPACARVVRADCKKYSVLAVFPLVPPWSPSEFEHYLAYFQLLATS